MSDSDAFKRSVIGSETASNNSQNNGCRNKLCRINYGPFEKEDP